MPPSSSSRTLRGPELPPRLLDLPVPPEKVHLLGELPLGPSVAIVGTRYPTPRGRRFAFELAVELARAGIAVFSGGAEGIDTAVHLGALRGRGATMVVAPAGYRVAYPEENARLFARVLQHGGAYLSLAGDAAKARRASFFERNALLAALAHVVVVVQAGFRSGARNTARWARRLERPLLVVPSSPWTAKGRGCLLELQRGAELCTRVEDVLRPLERVLALPARSLGLNKRKRTAPAHGQLPLFEPPALSGEEGQVVRAVRAGATHLDAICERSGLSASAVQRHILTLTLGGVIGPGPGGFRLLPPTELVSLSKTK